MNKHYSKKDWSKPSSSSSSSSSSNWLYEDINTSKLLLAITAIELNDRNNTDTHDLTHLDQLKSVGSYNWSTTSTKSRPVVIIPGQADKLLSELPKKQLEKSKRVRFVDENRHFYPEYPIEPLFRAVRYCSPQFDWKSVDVVTDRNNLNKLFRFIEGHVDESFRIDFQLVDNMLIMIRCDEKPSIICDDYSVDFKRQYTENGLDQGYTLIFRN